MPCIAECHDNEITVAPGWTTYESYAEADRPIFKCVTGEACPGGALTLESEDDSKCAVGYEGVLCGSCAIGYFVGGDGTCGSCSGTGAWSSIALVVFGGLFLGFAILQVKKYYQYFTILVLILESDLQTISKLVVAAGQIIAGVASQLNLQMPDVFASFTLSFLGIFRFDLAPLLGLGCISSGTYVSSLLFNMSLVLCVFILVFIHWQYQVHRISTDDGHDAEAHQVLLSHMYSKIDKDGKGINKEEVTNIVTKICPEQLEHVDKFFADADTDNSGILDKEQFHNAFHKSHPDDSGLDLAEFIQKAQKTEARQDAIGRLFLVIFLLYPQLTAKIFEAFHCRDLGEGSSATSVLVVDYTIDCGSSEYNVLVWVGFFLVLAWPIGVPAALLYQLNKHKHLIAEKDEDTMKEFDFIIGDYKPELFFWEVVELTRKLILSGLIGLAGRGSIAQCVFASMLAFGFFGLSLLCQPYKKNSLNTVKLVSEFQIFGVLLICIVLQVNDLGLENERIGEDGYGLMLVLVTMMIIPISLVFIASSLHDVYSESGGMSNDESSELEGELEHTENPTLDDGDDDDASED